MTMKLETTAGALHAALKTVKPACQPRNTIPILSHVLIKRDTMTATDLDMEIKAKIPASLASGSICLDHRVLSAIVGNLPKDTAITIQSEKERGATLSFEGGLYTLNSLPAADFPDLSVGPVTSSFKAPDGFLDKLRFVSHFISTEETRYYLNGVCIAKDHLVATDGHRLGYVDAGFELDSLPIIPRAAVHAVVDHLGEPNQIGFGERVVVFDFPGVVLRSKLIDGTYPDFKRVIPRIADNAPTLLVDAKRLVSMIRRVSATCHDRRTKWITCAFSPPGQLAVTHDTIGGSVSREAMPATVHGAVGESFVFAVNGRYLQNMALAHRGSGTLTLRFVDSGSPISVTSEREGFNSVQMPMRTGSTSTAREALTLLAPAPRLEAAE